MEHKKGDRMTEDTPITDENIKSPIPVLKPCPFCGGEANIAYNAKRKIYKQDKYTTGTAIYCSVCEAQMFYPTTKLAVTSWNRRVIPTE